MLHTYLFVPEKNMRQDTDQALLSSRTERCSEQDGDEAEQGVSLDGRCRQTSRARHASQRSGPNSRVRRRGAGGGRPAVAVAAGPGSGGTGCRHAKESTAVVIRFPGHDRKKPYNSFHRFEKVRFKVKKVKQFSSLRKGKVQGRTF